MDALRSFLSGRRLVIMGVLLAIPFVFFGSSSFGTVFTNYGKVNGLTVSALDVNSAINTATSEIKQMYGEEFNLDSLEDGFLNNRVRNLIISEKAFLYQALQLGLLISDEEAKRSIMSNPEFQTDGRFDQSIFEATVRSSGFRANDYIEFVQNGLTAYNFQLAILDSTFQLESEIRDQIKLIEQERDVDFFKIDFNTLKDNINPSMQRALEYYEANKLLFMDDEKRSFNLLTISKSEFKDQVEVPNGFVDEEYNNYVNKIEASAETRFSFISIDISDYDSIDAAYDHAKLIKSQLNEPISLETAARLTFERNKGNLIAQSETLFDVLNESINLKDSIDDSSDQIEDIAELKRERDSYIGSPFNFSMAAEIYSSDDLTKGLGGDLGFTTIDTFPNEIQDEVSSLKVGDISQIVESDGLLLIFKSTDEKKEVINSKTEMAEKFTNELIESESYALMLDLRDEIEDLLLSGISIEAIAEIVNKEITYTEPSGYNQFNLYNDIRVKDFLFNSDLSGDFAEILELDSEIIIAITNEIIEPSVLPFDKVTDEVFDILRENQANLEILEIKNNLVKVIDDASYVSDDSNVRRDFITVNIRSTALPQNILRTIFSSKVDSVNQEKAFNSDIYIFKVKEIREPSEEFIDSVVSDYQSLSSNIIFKQNYILSREINRKIRDNIKNLNI